MPVYEVALEALEPWLFGDNRSARAGVDHLLADQDPSPITVHGAVGRFVADRLAPSPGDWPQEFLGPQVEDVVRPRAEIARLLGYCLRTAAAGRFFPRPLHLRCRRVERGGEPALQAVDLLAPRPVPAGTSSAEPAYPRLALPPAPGAGPGERPADPPAHPPADRLADPLADPLEDEYAGEVHLSEAALGDVLCGELPTGDAGLWTAERLYRAEPRPGIAVDNRSGTVFEGAFFTRPYRRYQPPGADPQAAPGGFTAWLEALAPAPPELLAPEDPFGFVGGDRRRARLTLSECGAGARDVLAGLRRRVEAAAGDSAGFLLYLLTPALARALPWQAAGAAPLAAVTGRPLAVSGWDVARRRPRPIETLAPAGSVLFYDWPAGADRAALVGELWLAAVGDEGAAAGFGRVLVGVWR